MSSSNLMRWNAGVLLVIGTVLLFLLLMLDAPGSTVVLAAAVAWMGYALCSGAGEPALAG